MLYVHPQSLLLLSYWSILQNVWLGSNQTYIANSEVSCNSHIYGLVDKIKNGAQRLKSEKKAKKF